MRKCFLFRKSNLYPDACKAVIVLGLLYQKAGSIIPKVNSSRLADIDEVMRVDQGAGGYGALQRCLTLPLLAVEVVVTCLKTHGEPSYVWTTLVPLEMATTLSANVNQHTNNHATFHDKLFAECHS